ncbi:MAG: hypothetical protein WAV48_01645 [Candidatus Magasanikiibacteriota bacterium]
MSNRPTQLPVRPITFVPICEDQDIPLLLTNTGTTLCKDAEALYIRVQGKKVLIKKIASADVFMPSSLNLTVFQRNNVLHFEKFLQGNELKEIFSFTIPQNVTPISFFYSQLDEASLLFISAQKNATSPKDTKSVIYRISLDENDSSKTIVESAATLEMLRVMDAYHKGRVLLLRELFPFLTKKHRILNWSTAPEIKNDSCARNTVINLSNETPPCQEITSDTSQEFIKSESGNVQFDRAEHQLLWRPKLTETPKILLSNVNIEEWQLIAKYSTRIGKRVYNCIDFSESLKISLRICIPEI